MNATEKKSLKRTLVGTVVSDKMDKTVTVLIDSDLNLYLIASGDSTCLGHLTCRQEINKELIGIML